MSDVRVRLLLARMKGDDYPCVIAAIDESVWEHWDDAEEASWLTAGKRSWGIEEDTEFKVVVGTFPRDALEKAFDAPEVGGTVEASG